MNYVVRRKKSKLKKLVNKPWKIVLIFILSFLLINQTVDKIYGVNIVETGVKKFLAVFRIFTEEDKSVEFQTDNYIVNGDSGFEVQKSADWTSTGTAKVRFDVKSNMKTDVMLTDVVFVLDSSGSMAGEKILLVKNHAKTVAAKLVNTSVENKVAIVRFDTDAEILTGFTNDLNVINEKIDNVELGANTNYYRALKKTNDVLKGYRKQPDKKLVVLFLTDGYPNMNNPAQAAQYKLLKKRYPYIQIEGIQYEMGIDIVPDIISISDHQFVMNLEQVDNILFDAVYRPEYYESFEIVDYIDDEYFYLESVDDVTVPFGEVKLEVEEGKQKVTWTVGPNLYKTGTTASMEMNLILKEEYVEKKGYYSTNLSESVSVKLEGEDPEVVSSDQTPVLKSGYEVTYHANVPTGCSASDVIEEHFAFNNVQMIDTEPTCDGYVFKGYEFASEHGDSIKMVNSDVFVMPAFDVHLYGTWTKVGIVKDVQGNIVTRNTLYRHIESLSKGTDAEHSLNYNAGVVAGTDGVYESSEVSTTEGAMPIYFYRGTAGNVNNNIVLGDYCWLIIRTTETGGVKLLYNGERDPVSGACLAFNEGKKLERVIGQAQWNTGHRNFAYQGYTYNSEFNEKSYVVRNSSNTKYATSSRYWSKTVTYANGKYTLVNPEKGSAGNKVSAGLHYTCDGEDTSLTTCTSIRYVSSVVVENGVSWIIYIDAIKNGDDFNDVLAKIQGEGLTKENQTESPTKVVLEDWFADNMVDYQYMLEDTPYCNDRTITNSGLHGWLEGSKVFSAPLHFATHERADQGTPSNACLKRDSYTVSTETGNGLLDYPVGLMTTDEMMYAGGFYDQNSGKNHSWYVYVDASGGTFNQQSMSPGYYTGGRYTDGTNGHTFFYKLYAGSNGEIAEYHINFNGWSAEGTGYSLRPVVSLKPGTMLLGGTGTTADPYVIVT